MAVGWWQGRTHVRPGHEVVGALVEGHDNGVFDNVVGQFQVKRVLDEVEHGFAAGRVAPHLDIGLEVRDDSIRAVERLLVHGLEEHLHV